jgi:molecular chaperone DnaK (HSP70)
MASSQVPLVIDFAAEEERIPLPIKIAIGDQLVEVIGAGTKVPTRREIEISNAADDQDQMTIRIVQGASNRPEANAAVASYVITGIPLAPKGTLSIRLALEVTASRCFNLRADEGAKAF